MNFDEKDECEDTVREDDQEDTVREDFEEVKEEEKEQLESSATVNEEDQL